mmetsp:Transcript_92011/g.168739  ORF Transcript_92011/g.168739 Transcript_92011/m.168739 type:complete len:426 (-) Transcript_92011:58-1335(-)
MDANAANVDEESPGRKIAERQLKIQTVNPRWLDTYITAVGVVDFASTAVIMETVRFVMAQVRIEYTDLSSFVVGWVSSAIPAGALMGVLVGGALADSYGRRTVIMAGESLLMLSCLGVSLQHAPTVEILIGIHLIKGICFGAIIVCTTPWIIECVGTKERGILTSVANLGWVVGGLLVQILIKLGMISEIYSLELLPIPAALLAFLAISTASESRQWQHCIAARGRQTITAGLLDVPLGLIFKLALFWLTMPGVSYAIFFWAPTLLREHTGEVDVDLATLSSATLATVPIGLAAGWLIDYGRRSIIVSSLVICSITLLIMPFTSTTIWKVCYVVLECFISVAWTIGGIWTNELFPTRVRATAFGTMQCLARVSAMCGPILAGAARDWSSIGLYHLCAAVSVVSLCGVMLLDDTANETPKSLPKPD